jgi:hypothetical protein
MNEIELINAKLNDLYLMQQSSQKVIKSLWTLTNMLLQHNGLVPTAEEELILKALRDEEK